MSDESVDGLVTLTERTVNLVNQLNMLLVEVSLVLQKHLNQLMNTLNQHLASTGETVGARVRAPWPVEVESTTSSVSFDLEKVMNIVDYQRMDILDTLIRVTLVEINAFGDRRSRFATWNTRTEPTRNGSPVPSSCFLLSRFPMTGRQTFKCDGSSVSDMTKRKLAAILVVFVMSSSMAGCLGSGGLMFFLKGKAFPAASRSPVFRAVRTHRW